MNPRRGREVGSWLAGLGLVALVPACAPGGLGDAGRSARAVRAPPAANTELPETKARSEPQAEESSGPVEVAIRNRQTLRALETDGFALARVVADEDARTTAELNRQPGFRSIFDVLRDDVRAAKRTHPLAKVTSSDGFRLFDERWLDSNEMRFELTGVFNRLDRRVFYAESCGEIRFLYRLAYETVHGGGPMAGRLPLTVNVVFLVDGSGGCEDVARAWRHPPDATGPNAASWLVTTGPLAPSQRARWTLKSIETNLQSFRLQSFVHPTLAGHIEYVLRVFHETGAKRTAFAAAPMENMPDVPRLSKDRALRAELLAYLREPAVLRAVDLGTLNLPERFLAKRALSVSPRGLTRAPNRPFRALFSPSDFSGLPLAGTRTVGSPAALLRRLDGATCTGCHQSRSMAGFHHLGDDAAEHPKYDALFSGSSTHLETDVERRRDYVTRVARGEATDEFRPLPERQGTDRGYGAPCGLGDAGFSDWTCESGLRCEELEDEEVGVCLASGAIGAPCQYGELVSKPAPHRDLVASMKDHACGENQRCDGNRSGFPLGACAAACNAGLSSSACADFLDADGFQNCLRANLRPEQCEKDYVFGAGLRACDAERPCRQDYVCVRSRTPGVGACVPPYFVYQLRLDGYPLKR